MRFIEIYKQGRRSRAILRDYPRLCCLLLATPEGRPTADENAPLWLWQSVLGSPQQRGTPFAGGGQFDANGLVELQEALA